jgi:GntR family transcriptional regulator, transcriptional repressor for pyruvate dehydrogenase complex
VFNSIRNNKASDLIVSQIRKQIFTGKLVPGDRLPAERLLMGQFHVSKQTLREALRVLEFLGLVEIKKGVTGGACIGEIDSQIALDVLANFLYFKNLSIHNLAEVRKILEPHAAAIAALSMSEEEIKELKRLIDLSKGQYASGKVEEERFSNELDFHCVIASSTKNPLLILIVEFVESLMSDKKTMIKLDKPFLASVIKAHERIYEAILNRDAERAREEMSRHIVEVEQNMEKLEKRTPNDLKMFSP